MTHPDLHTFLEALEREGDVVRVEAEVDPRLEIAEIHRRVIAAGGPALVFTRVKGSPFPVATNLFGSARRVEVAFGPKPKRMVEEALTMPPPADNPFQRAFRFVSRCVGAAVRCPMLICDADFLRSAAKQTLRCLRTEKEGR